MGNYFEEKCKIYSERKAFLGRKPTDKYLVNENDTRWYLASQGENSLHILLGFTKPLQTQPSMWKHINMASGAFMKQMCKYNTSGCQNKGILCVCAL